MALKKFKPNTPGTRQLVTVDRSGLHKGAPEKTLLEGKKKTGGRNNTGRITCRHVGGGHKQKYRVIDWKRRKFDVEATVLRLEYDPNRTAFIALVEYKDGEKAYILAPQRLQAGDKVIASTKADIKPGNAMPLQGMPVGTIIHNIEMKPGKGGQLCRSAGTYAQLVGRDQGYAQIKLASGELRKVPNMGKAGRKRWMGVRPTVRGVVMNPVDHPHGGGEGRTSGGRHPVSFSGVPTKGFKTRSNKATDKFIVRRRKK